jgi:hypothetical protein
MIEEEQDDWQERIAEKKLNRLGKKSAKRKKRNNDEESEQVKFISYLRRNHPEIIYHANPEGVRLTIGQAVKLSKQGVINRSTPDIFIFKSNDLYHGLIIELKKKDWKLYKLDGELYKDEHVVDQRNFLNRFNDAGYFATFANGFDVAKEIFLSYLNNEEDIINKLKII